VPCYTRDGGRPSGDGLQDQSSKHPTLRGAKNPGGERIGEKAEIFRQVRIRKANVSEPSMRCREGQNAIETRLRIKPWDEARKGPVYGPGGGRHRGGASRVQALVWNVGTERSDDKGEVRGEAPRRASVPRQDAGTDRFVVAAKPGNAGRAKEPACPASSMRQPGRGGARA
jgi:hypothetical protein